MGNPCLCPQAGQQVRYGLMFPVVAVQLTDPADGPFPGLDLHGFFDLPVAADGIAFPLQGPAGPEGQGAVASQVYLWALTLVDVEGAGGRQIAYIKTLSILKSTNHDAKGKHFFY